jgi:hypothetical protein
MCETHAAELGALRAGLARDRDLARAAARLAEAKTDPDAAAVAEVLESLVERLDQRFDLVEAILHAGAGATAAPAQD